MEYDVLSEIGKKEIAVGVITKRVIENPELLPAVLKGFLSKSADIKFKSAKILVQISKEKPDLLYSYFDFFAEQLSNRNNTLKWNAMDVLANLTLVDSQNKFDKLMTRFYAMLYEGSLITAGHVVSGSVAIVKAKPYLEDKATKSILDVDKIPLPTEECRNIIKGQAIKTFEQYFDYIGNKADVIDFTRKELKNTRNATRKKAEVFLARRAK